jgi:hypothetical protein
MSLHPTIEAFQAGAEVLDAQDSHLDLDDAIAQLAGWLDLASDHLADDDVTVLTGIGAVLYREGLRRRSGDLR